MEAAPSADWSAWAAAQVGSTARLDSALDALPAVLGEGEEPLCAASGFLVGHTGLVVATDRRLIFLDGHGVERVSDPYPSVRRFRARHGVVAHELYVEDGSGIHLIKQIHPRERLAQLAAILAHPPSDGADHSA